jgi:hypothetical protein
MVSIGEAKDAQELTNNLDVVAFDFVARIEEAVRRVRIDPPRVDLWTIAADLGCQEGIDGPAHEFRDRRSTLVGVGSQHLELA